MHFRNHTNPQKERKQDPVRVFLIRLILVVLVLLTTFAYWSSFQSTMNITPSLVTESWEVISDGAHNAFTDLIAWKDYFYVVYRSAPNHLDPSSKLVIMRSLNSRTWEKLTELVLSGEDIRDPKFALIGNQLFIYALKNTNPVALPYATVYSTSEDGKTWTPWQMIEPAGWLFWRPKTWDGLTWYVPAYSSRHDQTALFQSKDGKKWEKASEIYSGEPQSEVEVTFSNNGNLVAIIRMESPVSTLIAFANSPFGNWTTVRSLANRLDGPVLFLYHDAVYAVGRSEPENGILFGARGGLFNKKRTSIFSVTPSGLKKLTDLPSNGDTSYPGIVIRGDEAYISYYTNDIQQDLPWLIGQFSPTSIRIAKINLPMLEQARLIHP